MDKSLLRQMRDNGHHGLGPPPGGIPGVTVQQMLEISDQKALDIRATAPHILSQEDNGVQA